MSNTVHTHQGEISGRTEKLATTKTQKDLWELAEFYRYGITPLLLIFMVCISGIAAGFGAPGDALQIAIVALPTCIALALVLAVAPMRTIIYTAAVAVFLDLFILIF